MPTLADWSALDAHLGPDCIRVASYNVHGCVGRDGREDVARIAEVILETGCDTVGLQEVNSRDVPGHETPHHSAQLDYLAHATGMTAIPGLTLITNEGHFGNALLTRRPVRAVRRHALAGPRWTEPRNALDVELDVDGEALRVIVTHLGLLPSERRAQARRLLEIVADTPTDERLVMLGDFNEWMPFGRPLRWLHSLFGRSPAERTFPSGWPMLALDRVWLRPRRALIAVGAHRSALAAVASDHLPLKAVVAAAHAGRDHRLQVVGSRDQERRMPLNAEQEKEFRKALEARRTELMREIDADVSKLDEDSGAGEVRDTGDDSVAQLFGDVDRADLQRDMGEVRELDAALARMDEGEYGICVDCGGEIGLDRLRAQPTALRDVRCQTIYEKTFAQPRRARL